MRGYVRQYAPAYSRSCDAIACPQSDKGPLPCLVEMDRFRHLGFRHFGHTIGVSSWHRFWMGIGSVTLAASSSFRMGLDSLSGRFLDTFPVLLENVAPFGPAIFHIVGMRTKEEVPGIDAEFHVAGVADEQLIRGPLSRMEEPTDDMGAHVARLFGGRTKLAIAMGMGRTKPQPAGGRVSLRDFGPKAVSERGRWMQSASILGDTLDRAVQRPVLFEFLCIPAKVQRKCLGAGSITTHKGNGRACHQRTSTAVTGCAPGLHAVARNLGLARPTRRA
jgi:hypothetical protein